VLSAAEKAQRVLRVLEGWYGAATTELRYRNPYELAVAVVLSAQCTDVRVNQTTPAFFERFPDFETLAQAEPEEVFSYIRSISYPNSKAQRLVALARTVMERYGGKLPEDPAELATLPGIGRKSANVIASVLFQAPVIAVDTHVFRVSRRLGLAKGNTPEKVEQELMGVIPASYLGQAHHWLILFGRYHCLARRPKCGECPFTELCDWYQSQLSGAGASEVSGEGADGEVGEVGKAVSGRRRRRGPSQRQTQKGH
jgi:endonuclease-3